LGSDWNEFSRRNVSVVAIAIQKIDGVAKARRFLEEQKYAFPILFDQTRSATKAYGVYHVLGIDAFRIARPAIFVLDRRRIIRWIAISPHQLARPSTADIIAAVDAAARS
jgi:peroxiredoxin